MLEGQADKAPGWWVWPALDLVTGSGCWRHEEGLWTSGAICWAPWVVEPIRVGA